MVAFPQAYLRYSLPNNHTAVLRVHRALAKTALHVHEEPEADPKGQESCIAPLPD